MNPSTAPDSLNPFALFKLPPELRNIIYSYLFEIGAQGPLEAILGADDQMTYNLCLAGLSILVVEDKNLHAEVSRYLFQDRPFIIKTTLRQDTGGYAMRKALKDLGPLARIKIQNLVIYNFRLSEFSRGQPWYCGEEMISERACEARRQMYYAIAMLRMCPNLTALTLGLDSFEALYEAMYLERSLFHEDILRGLNLLPKARELVLSIHWGDYEIPPVYGLRGVVKPVVEACVVDSLREDIHVKEIRVLEEME